MFFILTFFLGAAVGSFINVLIDRSVAGEDWVKGRSHCDNCHKSLAWYDLIPLLSFVWYRGRSRCCRTPLSYRYPLVEGLTGLLFGWWLVVGFVFFRLTVTPLLVIQPVFWLVTGIVMLTLALADQFYGVVLMPVVWFGGLVAVGYRAVLWYFGAYQGQDLAWTAVMSVVAYGLFWGLYKITRGKGMAEGDMYVAAYVGLLSGWPEGWLSLGLSFVLGAVGGLVLMALGVKGRKDTLPFVPFMMTATLVVLVWGERIIRFLG